MLNHKKRDNILIQRDIERLQGHLSEEVIRLLEENDKILAKHVSLEYFDNMSNKH